MVEYDDFEMPKTWKGKMEALVAGVIDYDDWHELAMECAEVADRGHHPCRPCTMKADSWSETMPILLDWLLMSQGEEISNAKKLFAKTAVDIVRCGEAADLVEAGEIPATP